jgi:hypothetical protein
MNIEILPEERALLNGLIASRQCDLDQSLSNCKAIEDKEHRKSAKASIKKEQKQLEALCEKINTLELAIPNKIWGSERSIL